MCVGPRRRCPTLCMPVSWTTRMMMGRATSGLMGSCWPSTGETACWSVREFKILLFIFHCVKGSAPHYKFSSLHTCQLSLFNRNIPILTPQKGRKNDFYQVQSNLHKSNNRLSRRSIQVLNFLKICLRPYISLKLPGRDGCWMVDYATCGRCHLAHDARFALSPRLLQRYDRWVSRMN